MVLDRDDFSTLVKLLQEHVVGCDELVHQLALQRVRAEPRLPSRNEINIHLRSLGLYPILEEHQHLFDISLSFGEIFIRGLFRGRQCPLVFARGNSKKLDALLIQTLVHVGHLRDNTDAANDSERRGGDFVRTSRHHVTARGRHLLNADVELETESLDSH